MPGPVRYVSVRCGCRAAARTDGYGRRPYGPADLPGPQTLLSFHSRAADLAMTGAGRRPAALGPGLSATGTSSAYDSAWARDRRLRTAACQSPRRDPRSGLGETVLAPALARRLVGAGHCSAAALSEAFSAGRVADWCCTAALGRAFGRLGQCVVPPAANSLQRDRGAVCGPGCASSAVADVRWPGPRRAAGRLIY